MSMEFILLCQGNNRLRVFKKRVLRRIFRPKTDKVTGGWRIHHNEELYNFYSSEDIIRMNKSSSIN
jgi:hypothetical protein